MDNEQSRTNAPEMHIKTGKPRKDAGSRKAIKQGKLFLRELGKMSRSRSSSSGRNTSPARGSYLGTSCFVKTPLKSNQRVVVKARYVKHKNPALAQQSITSHVSYISRDSACISDENGAQILCQNGRSTEENLTDFTTKTAQDKHDFRFIISPENAHKMDLNEFTKTLMQQMENDLKTKLEFVAVSHFNTDNPHTHIIVRGCDDQGNDLVISRDYIANGIRNRASEIATQMMGQRTQLEIREGITKEVKQDRYTQLDRELLKLKNAANLVHIQNENTAQDNSFIAFKRNVHLQRVKHLEELGLAHEQAPGVWYIEPAAEQVLKDMSIRGDIIKTMHSKLNDRGQELVIYDPQHISTPIVGEVVEKGLVNELHDDKYMIVNATDNRAYYVKLSRYSEDANFESVKGSIVKITPNAPKIELKKADKNILEIASKNSGIYTAESHLNQIENGSIKLTISKENYISNHLKRLDLLEKNGLVTRVDKDSWSIPSDLEKRMIELSHTATGKHAKVVLESRLDMSGQVSAQGLTWIDKQLIENTKPARPVGRESEFRTGLNDAYNDRVEFLIQNELAQKTPSGIQFKSSIRDDLYAMQLADIYKKYDRIYGQGIDISGGDTFSGSIEKLVNTPSGPHCIVRDQNKYVCIPYSPGMAVGKRIDLQYTRINNQTKLNYNLAATKEVYRGR